MSEFGNQGVRRDNRESLTSRPDFTQSRSDAVFGEVWQRPVPALRPRVSATLRFFVAIPLALFIVLTGVSAAPPAPRDVIATDEPLDGGHAVRIEFTLPDADETEQIIVEKAGEDADYFVEVSRAPTVGLNEIDPVDGERRFRAEVDGLVRGSTYWFRLAAVDADGEVSPFVPAETSVTPTRQWFNGDRRWFAVITLAICGTVIGFILAARSGLPLYIRRIAGLDAVEEAVGRSTEMGRSNLFVPGILDMNDMQTIAGLTILSHVAGRAAEYDSTVDVPTSKSLVMTAARETVESAYLTAGRPDAYDPDQVYYVTDEQFGYVAYLSGKMVREKPAACFYMGAFYAESLILAETGNTIGAIQVAGTAQPAQLPFFVAACDYTLIGEEFFAASAYLSGDPDQLGALKGQDLGKIFAGALIVVGCALMTYLVFDDAPAAAEIVSFLKDRFLGSGS